MKVGLFFGSFNPVHNGHIEIAKEILNQKKLQKSGL
jgi:cytidyltransferase-like protein